MWQVFPFVDKISKLQEKTGSMWVPITSYKQNIRGRRGYSYIHMELGKNIRSVNLDWRQRPAGHSSRPVSSLCMFGSRTTSQKVPHHKRNIYAISLRLYSYYTQSSPSKNKNISYIFIYLRVLPCLSSWTICDTYSKHICIITIWRRSSYPK